MTAVTLPTQLMDQVEQVASERAVEPQAVLEEAVRVYLRQLERDKIKAEAEAYRALHTDPMKQHMGEYIAIHDGHVVDHDPDFATIHQRIRHRYGRQPVLLRRVEAEPERTLVFPSFRLETERYRHSYLEANSAGQQGP